MKKYNGLKVFPFIVSLLAASTSIQAAEESGEPIRIGAVLAVTGPASFLGDPALKTLQMAVERWNEEGGIEGRPVELTHYDSGGSASDARTYANRLLSRDQVDVIIGGSTTGTSMAILPQVERFQVPFIALGSGVGIIEPVRKWTFKVPHTDRMVAERVLRHMQANGAERIALMSATSGFGQSGRDEMRLKAEELGMDIVIEETFADDDSDVTAQLTRIRSQDDVDALMIFGAGRGPAIVARNADQIGLNLPIYQSHGAASEEFIRLAGDAAEEVYVASAAILVADQLADDDPQKDVLTEFERLYRERWDESASAFGGNAWDATMLLEEAVQEAGTQSDSLRDAIERISGLVATNGTFNMSPEDHNGISFDSLKILQVREQSFQLVE
ncbi:ABC transporter substrate-binding protein [Aquisalimonas lutea]|uniref:ABC transporter substrate-binding protein n=1 Tax=Aquisalimonas lutea TaxID=1327750 RepID=UPI0025B54803|nr:ABC transporter substrate-binding protein [Aquisalimonas lutea]MDN3518102.1 ABC transporter substrate-binding protein [Aquisalimonas lutea]